LLSAGHGEAPEDALGEGSPRRSGVRGIGAGGTEVFVALDHEDAGSDALEGDDLAPAFLTAVEADIVGAEARRRDQWRRDGGVQAGDFQPEIAGALFPIDGEEAVELLHAAGALLDWGMRAGAGRAGGHVRLLVWA